MQKNNLVFFHSHCIDEKNSGAKIVFFVKNTKHKGIFLEPVKVVKEE